MRDKNVNHKKYKKVWNSSSSLEEVRQKMGKSSLLKTTILASRLRRAGYQLKKFNEIKKHDYPVLRETAEAFLAPNAIQRQEADLLWKMYSMEKTDRKDMPVRDFIILWQTTPNNQAFYNLFIYDHRKSISAYGGYFKKRGVRLKDLGQAGLFNVIDWGKLREYALSYPGGRLYEIERARRGAKSAKKEG